MRNIGGSGVVNRRGAGAITFFAASALVVSAIGISGCHKITALWSSSGGQDPVARSQAVAFTIRRSEAETALKFLTAEPHVLGSARQTEVAEYLVSSLKTAGLESVLQTFAADVPNHEVDPKRPESVSQPMNATLVRQGANVVAFLKDDLGKACQIIVGSHYDTKRIPEFPYVGANDSASSSVLLLELARFYAASMADKASAEQRKCGLLFVWFDGEEAWLTGWDDWRSHPSQARDNTYGSRYFVSTLQACAPLSCLPPQFGGSSVNAMINIDMIGSKNLVLSRESGSHRALIALAEEGATAVGQPKIFGRTQKIEDDHMAFAALGIPAVDLIDFENMQHWHQPGDVIETLSLESMEMAGRIAMYTFTTLQITPSRIPTR